MVDAAYMFVSEQNPWPRSYKFRFSESIVDTDSEFTNGVSEQGFRQQMHEKNCVHIAASLRNTELFATVIQERGGFLILARAQIDQTLLPGTKGTCTHSRSYRLRCHLYVGGSAECAISSISRLRRSDSFNDACLPNAEGHPMTFCLLGMPIPQEKRLLLLGLDAAGKTCLLVSLLVAPASRRRELQRETIERV